MKPLVVMMCGLAGSGKTTYSQRLEAVGFVRLSIDEQVWSRFGRYGIDYPVEEYAALSGVARAELEQRLVTLLSDGRNVVVDSSFWQRSSRDRYKSLVEQHGGQWRLVHLSLDQAELERRLRVRAERFDANAAFPITAEVMADYLQAFEPPTGEGEEDGTALAQSFSIGGE